MATKFNKTWLLDMGERCLKTFVQVFLAQIIASGMDLTTAMTNVSTVEKAAVAGIGAVLSVVFSVASAWAGSPGNASALPEGYVADVNGAPLPDPDNPADPNPPGD